MDYFFATMLLFGSLTWVALTEAAYRESQHYSTPRTPGESFTLVIGVISAVTYLFAAGLALLRAIP